jgi:hypothetical protein
MDILSLPSEILALIGRLCSACDCLSLGQTCKRLIEIVVPPFVRELQEESRLLCELAERVDRNASKRMVFSFLAFCFVLEVPTDRQVINVLNNLVMRKARQRLGPTAKQRTIGNPCHWDVVAAPVNVGMVKQSKYRLFRSSQTFFSKDGVFSESVWLFNLIC